MNAIIAFSFIQISAFQGIEINRNGLFTDKIVVNYLIFSVFKYHLGDGGNKK